MGYKNERLVHILRRFLSTFQPWFHFASTPDMIRRLSLGLIGQTSRLLGGSSPDWGSIFAEDQMNDVSSDRWLSVDEIAAYLGVKRDTIYKWIDRKKLPAHKVGILWKFRKEEIDAWVRSGEAADRVAARKPR